MTTYTPPAIWQWHQPNDNRSGNRPTAGARFTQSLPRGQHALQLYSLGTPNGIKVVLMLEELLALGKQAQYDVFKIDIREGEQFGSDFVQINPNSKIPALLDTSVNPPLPVMESGNILLYLAEKFQAFLPTAPVERSQVLGWLFWQMGSAPFLGGGFGHFYYFAPEKQAYPIDRFAMEAKRQFDVLNRQLAERPYIAGVDYSIADMAIWPWYGRLAQGALYGDAAQFLSVQDYKYVIDWANRIGERPAAQRALQVPHQPLSSS